MKMTPNAHLCTFIYFQYPFSKNLKYFHTFVHGPYFVHVFRQSPTKVNETPRSPFQCWTKKWRNILSPTLKGGKGGRAVKNFETILKPIKNQNRFMCFVGDCLEYI